MKKIFDNEEIKKAYEEFDNFYEEAELPPYDTAYKYFEAGVRWAERQNNKNDN